MNGGLHSVTICRAAIPLRARLRGTMKSVDKRKKSCRRTVSSASCLSQLPVPLEYRRWLSPADFLRASATSCAARFASSDSRCRRSSVSNYARNTVPEIRTAMYGRAQTARNGCPPKNASSSGNGCASGAAKVRPNVNRLPSSSVSRWGPFLSSLPPGADDARHSLQSFSIAGHTILTSIA